MLIRMLADAVKKNTNHSNFAPDHPWPSCTDQADMSPIEVWKEFETVESPSGVVALKQGRMRRGDISKDQFDESNVIPKFFIEAWWL